MRRIVLALLVGTLASAASAASAGFVEYIHRGQAPAQAPEFDETSLQKLLGDNPATGRPVDSIDELVPLLPRELRANITYVYDSRSPFRATISPQRPRVILFTNDGRLVLTFTGAAAGQPGADLLETMTFDEGTAKFVLHSYLLPAAQRRPWRPSPAAANCASCHGADPRPIFDAYPLWPGFYGAFLDTFPRDRLGTTEEAKYKTFLASEAKTAPYAGLLPPAGSPVTPYLDPRLFSEKVSTLGPPTFPYMPSARLGMALSDLNWERIYRKLTEGRGFLANEKRLLAELLDCGGAAGPSPQVVQATKAQLLRDNADRLTRLGLRPGEPHPARDDMQELGSLPAMAEIVDVAAKAGADRSDWSMAREPDSLALYDGILSGVYRGRSYRFKEGLIAQILAHLAERDPAFRPYFVPVTLLASFGYPFGRRVDLGPALKSCHLLSAPAVAAR